MKIRTGFVSNSSSSSFVCDVCNRETSGYDATLEEVEMTICKNGHTVCTKHLLGKISIEEIIDIIKQKYEKLNNKYDKENLDRYEKCKDTDSSEDFAYQMIGNYEIEYSYPSKYCPICQFKSKITPEELLMYLFKKHDTNWENEMTEIKEKFKDINELYKFKKS